MSIILTIAYRAAIAYVVLLVLSRIMGRKMISQMTLFDFVVGVMAGTVAGSASIVMEAPLLSSVTGLVTITVLTVLIGTLAIKSFAFRKFINSEPVILIENGKIVNKNMKKIRFSLDELMMHLREKDIFNVADVEFALLETDGKMSVLPKSQKKAVTPEDLNLHSKYKGLTKDLVLDGRIMDENLEDIKLNEKWLTEELRKNGVDKIQDVFYAGLDTLGTLYISKRSNDEEKQGQHGIE